MKDSSAAPQAASPFDALMDAAVDAIIIIDREGRIRRFNQAAERLFGYEEREVLGQNVSLLMPEPHRSRHDKYLLAYRRTGQATIIGRGREETGLRRNGETFPMLLSVGEVKQPGMEGYVGIIRDLTEVRQARAQVRTLEDQLLHADRLVILGELTAGIAHEINQPLTAIAAYADAGRRIADRLGEAAEPDGPGAEGQGAQGHDMHTICERIGGQARRAGEVVQRLRGLVRTGRAQKARHDINQIIRNILLLFEFELKRSDVFLDFAPVDPPETVYVDEIQVQQILVNLVKNGLDAINESGRPDGHISIRAERQGGELVVSVTDNGPGVPDDLQKQLFNAFFTTKPKGVGLGLSICKSIAAAHGGSLHYEPVEAGGSRFALHLPMEFIG